MDRLTAPAEGGYSVTPHDTNNNVVGENCRAITVLVSGNVKLLTKDDETLTIYVAAGAPFPFRGVKRIFATDTTATGIVVLY